MKLSLCLAVYNEEKNLHIALDSAYDIADEVVIVDGGSTDKTVEIVKAYGKKVRVIVTDNPVMFHKNKQKAIEAAKGEWILQLDADEAVSKELKSEIRTIINNNLESKIQNSESKEKGPKNQNSKINSEFLINNSRFVAYWIPRKNWFLTGFLMKGGQYPDYTIRLYRNGYAKFPCKDVHENVEIITPSVISAKAGIQSKNHKLVTGYLQNPILHYADPDFSRYLMRWDRYTTAEVERMFLGSKSSKVRKLSFFKYFIWYPKKTFFLMYFRHKGFMDGFPGFVFALFSSIRFWAIYIKWKVKMFESLKVQK